MKRHRNTYLRMKNVCEIVQQHYEIGNQSKCYKAVWRNYVYPVYPMCYHTFLNYISAEIPKNIDTKQLNLFDEQKSHQL